MILWFFFNEKMIPKVIIRDAVACHYKNAFLMEQLTYDQTPVQWKSQNQRKETFIIKPVDFVRERLRLSISFSLYPISATSNLS